MQYHSFRFGFVGNFKVLLCRIFGHRLNEDPSFSWCERCNLCYEECYYPKNYFEESGIIDVSKYDENGNLKCSECARLERE